MAESRPHDDEPLLKIAARRVLRWARAEAATPAFGRLLLFQASGAAGDALLALALAGSLFFSVPEATARGRVALYLALTMAPLALVAPFLSAFLDRHRGGLRAAIVMAALGRGTLAWLLATRLDSLYLFPIAFGILVLSRAALVVRGALLPELAPEGRPLVNANASLSKVGAIAGMAAVPVGLILIQWPGPATEILVGAFVYYVGVLPALGVPASRGRRGARERIRARSFVRTASVRGAVVAMTGMRVLVGFLVMHLAFAFRREDFGSIGLGVLLGSAATGALLGALITPRVRKRLKEEGILAASLAVAGLAGILAGRYFNIGTAALLVGVFGIASGAAKVAFDSIVQRDTPAAARGWAFARFESLLQLAWVVGGLIPLALTIQSGTGVLVAGILANLLAIVYLLGRRRVASSRLP